MLCSSRTFCPKQNKKTNNDFSRYVGFNIKDFMPIYFCIAYACIIVLRIVYWSKENLNIRVLKSLEIKKNKGNIIHWPPYLCSFNSSLILNASSLWQTPQREVCISLIYVKNSPFDLYFCFSILTIYYSFFLYT